MNTKCRQAVQRYKMFSHGDSIVVGLSGGADSCALLHWLCSVREEYALKIKAVHLNHMIRGEEADRDALHAENLCQRLCVPFKLYTLDVPKIAAEKGQGLEECGREQRYRIFAEEASQDNAKIATAHTLSDSVETVLFHIIRGCAINGLRGIPPVRGNIIRPLIMCERNDIEAYCSAHNIEYVTDSTNLSSDYTRNKIRLQILPLMREINPSVLSAIYRLSECAAEDDDYLLFDSECIAIEDICNCKAEQLCELKSPVLKRFIVRSCEKHLGITPEYRHIELMQECIKKGCGTVNLTGGNHFSVTGDTVKFYSDVSKKTTESSYEGWHEPFKIGEIPLPDGQRLIIKLIDRNKYEEFGKYLKNVFKNSLDYDTILNTSEFRYRLAGDCFAQAGRGNTKSLKKLFNENKIPVEMRDHLPMLANKKEICWISGIGPSEGHQVTASTKRILYIECL